MPPWLVKPRVSPARKPPAIETVAETSVALSASLTVNAGDSVTAGPACAKIAPAATLLITGASLTAVMLIVVVARVLLSVPSLTAQLMLRLLSVPKLVGLWLLEENVTDSSAA